MLDINDTSRVKLNLSYRLWTDWDNISNLYYRFSTIAEVRSQLLLDHPALREALDLDELVALLFVFASYKVVIY